MTAVDTDLLVRLLTGDDPAQAERAAEVIRGDSVFIPKTVLLETEWVLRHVYGKDREVIGRAFKRLLGLPNVSVEDTLVVARAISWHAQGLDFADALHLASCADAQRFLTFDRALAGKARGTDSIPVELL